MLNDNYIFLNNFPSTRNRSYFQPPTSSYCTERNLEMERGCYFLDDYYSSLVDQEEHRQYEAAMQRRAYIEAMERRRLQKLLEEQRRQHLFELERKRYEQEKEEKKRQYLNLLKQQRFQQERKEKAKAAAFEARKRHQNLRRIANNRSHPMEQIVQTPDGEIYRVFVEPSKNDEVSPQRNVQNLPNLFPATFNGNRQPEIFDRTSHGNDLEVANMTPSPSTTRKVQFKNCSSTDQHFEGAVSEVQPSSRKSKQKQKKSSISLQKKELKSSVLVGDVEDASDSECEDDFNDYWHNRRPQFGKWIEPIEGAATHFH